MNRTTTGLCLAALLVSCSMNSVLRADELVMRDNFFVADETRHQWVNEHNGRTGMLTVSGALLSSRARWIRMRWSCRCKKARKAF